MFATKDKVRLKLGGGWREFYGGDEIGFDKTGRFVLDLYTTPEPEPRGAFSLCLPISPKWHRYDSEYLVYAYRENNCFTITDDWGRPHTIESSKEVIDQLCEECKAENIFVDDNRKEN
jgi:hypothetical protein